MNNIFKILPITLAIVFVASNLSASEASDKEVIEQGQTWSLIKKSNRLSPHNSKVLYFFQLMPTIHIRQEGLTIGMNSL